MLVRRSCCLFLLCSLAVSLALAQSTGRIKGRVVNGEKGINGVIVRVVQTGALVFSDEQGTFSIGDLPAGSYTLMLSNGKEEVARIVAVTQGRTTELTVDVGWDTRVFEKVKVTAGAERAGKIVDAPAAVTMVSDEQIERQASHGQLPKVLEYTPGAEVTQSGLYDFNFNTRGFNSSLNRRVSTYIDGRDVGVPLLGAQEWAALSIPLDDLASLEFIRGPSAALYGANASSGVIKMITRSPNEAQGGMFRLTGGEIETRTMDFRWAQELGAGWSWKVVAGTRNTGDFSVSRNPCPGQESCVGPLNPPLPEYSRYCRRVGESDCLQQERSLLRENNDDVVFSSVRADKTLPGGAYLSFETGGTKIEGPAFQTGIGRVQIVEARRPWGRVAYSHPHWNVLVHWANRDAHQVSLAKALRGRDNVLFTDTVRYGVEMQTNWNFGGDRGRFVIGGAHTQEEIDSTDPVTGRQTVVFKRIETDRQAIFSQLDWKVNDHFKLVFAGRADWNTLHKTQVSPKVAAVYSVNPKHSFRFTYNEAFQVANYSEFFLSTRLTTFPLFSFSQLVCTSAYGPADKNCSGIVDNPPVLAVGNDDLELEKTSAFELGYSAILKNKAFLTIDYYNSNNKNFITDLVPPYETSLGSPINPDYPEWVGPQFIDSGGMMRDTEVDPAFPSNPNETITVAEAIRGNVKAVLGNLPFGMRLSQNLDGSTVIVGRTYANVGEVETQGVDLGLNLFVSDKWSVQFSYSWFDFELVNAAADVKDILLPNSPEHKVSASLGYRNNSFDLTLGGRWVDAFRWSAGVFQGDVGVYSTVDLSMNWRVNDHVRFGVNAANALDHVHRQTFGGDLLARRFLTHVTTSW